jgi:hypothetical protein
MKIYGFVVGCTKVLSKSNDEEIFTVTTFSSEDKVKSNKILERCSLVAKCDESLQDLPDYSFHVTQCRSLSDEKRYRSHCDCHYLVRKGLTKDFLTKVRSLFPISEYILLD